MEEDRYILRLPAWVWTELDHIARERCCSKHDLFGEQVVRITADAEFHSQMGLALYALLLSGNLDLETSWPSDAREALAVGYLLYLWEKSVEKGILDLSSEDIASLDAEVKRTGRTIDQIALQRLFGDPVAGEDQHDSGDWWKTCE